MLPSSASIPLLAALLIASGPAAGAELYKWTDQNGVVNYSNTPPPKDRGGKPATRVEETISVYTPERSVTEAIERDKTRRAQKPPAASLTREPVPERRPAVTSAPPAATYDPCRNPNDLNCPGVIYDRSPVFNGRRRHQPLVQPQLPPGTLAGQGAGPGAYIPGQSGTAQPPPATAPRRSSGAPLSIRGDADERRSR